MKTLKYLILVGALCTGLSSLTHAALIGPSTVTLSDSGEQTELAGFIAFSGDTDATICDKLDTNDPFGTGPITQNGFTYTFGQNLKGQYTVTVSFDFSGTNRSVCGFAVKDGGGTVVNFYALTGAGQKGGSFKLLVPANANTFGQLSHVTVFCCAGSTTVPDSGTTAMLLGGALTGIGLARRYFKR